MRIEPELSFGNSKELHSKNAKNFNDNRKGISEGIDFYSAPRLDQVAQWLREEHGIYVEPCFIYEPYFEVLIKSQRVNIFTRMEEKFNTYEQALSAGIDSVLKLLEK